jgi:hypothetical protein
MGEAISGKQEQSTTYAKLRQIEAQAKHEDFDKAVAAFVFEIYKDAELMELLIGRVSPGFGLSERQIKYLALVAAEELRARQRAQRNPICAA